MKMPKHVKPKSLTFWTGVASVGTGIGLIATGFGAPAGLPLIFGGFGLIGVRGAIP